MCFALPELSLRSSAGSLLTKSLIWLMACLPVCASTYYVSNSGSDSNSGTSPSTPWQTVARVNASSFSGDDVILFNRGDVWHEQLLPSFYGSQGHQITISAYGTGANPLITGANTITQWNGSGSSTVAGCSGSCIFSSGMESPNFSDWSQIYQPSVDGTTVSQSTAVTNSGSYSLQLKGTGIDNRAGLTQSFPALSPESVLYFRFYMYVPVGALKPNDHFLIFQVPAQSSNVSLSTDDNGNISVLQFYSVGGSIVNYAVIPFHMGAWNYFDIAYKVGATDGGGEVRLNGTLVGSNYSLNTLGSLGVNSATVGNDSFGHGQVAGGSIYLDDFEIATSGPIGALGSGGSSGGSPTNGIYSASLPVQPNVVFIAGNPGIQKYSSSELNANGQWSWSQGTLYVYSSSGTPSNVEAAQRDYALLLGQTGGGSYITVSGIDFRVANADVIHIVNTSGDIINGCLITGAYEFGLVAAGVPGTTLTNLQVTNNTVSMNQSSGIEISSGHAYVTVQGNNVFGNAFNPTYSGNYIEMGGIKLLGASTLSNNDLVQYNVVNNNGVKGGDESQGNGVWFDRISNSTMQYNVSFNNTAHGLYLEKAENSAMLNNISYSNAIAPNTANLTLYSSEGVPSSGNVVANNIAWNSFTWGLKAGAYQGTGATSVSNNTFENNVVLNSNSLDVFVDYGANNDGVHGNGNVFMANAFGLPVPSWLYWVGFGSISSYSDLDKAYGSPMGNNQSNWYVPVGGQSQCDGSCLFSSGVESSSFSDWSGVYQPASDGTTVTQNADYPHSGTYSLRVSGGGQDNRGGLTRTFPGLASGGALYFRFYVNIPAGALKANDQFSIFQVPTGGATVSLGTDTHGSVNSLEFSSYGGTILATTPISFPMSAWNYVDVELSAGAGNGGGQVWVNGSSVGANFGVNTASSAGASSAILGNTAAGHGQVAGGNIYFDDFTISNAGPIGAAIVAVPYPIP